jgi:glycosyltransferase involved in cell wall biosynthesis
MKDIPKVTVATITYNSSAYVRQAIESVLAQGFADFEYFISDDCSTDNTWEIIQDYRDPRIKAWRNERNLGEYPNRNKTLAKAKGEYIIWIDGDDVLYPHGLEFMVRMLDAFPSSAMLCARPYSRFIIYPYELNPRQMFQLELMGSPVLVDGLTDTLFRTRILNEANGFPTNFISGDTYVKRFISLQYPSLFVSNGVSWWRRTENQASSKLDGKEGIIQTFNIQLEYIERAKFLLDDAEVQYAMDRLCTGFLRFLVRKYFLKFKVIEAFHLLKGLNLRGSIWVYLFRKRPTEFKLATSVAPLHLAFDKNPFSSSQKRNA